MEISVLLLQIKVTNFWNSPSSHVVGYRSLEEIQPRSENFTETLLKLNE